MIFLKCPTRSNKDYSITIQIRFYKDKDIKEDMFSKLKKVIE